MAFFRVPRFCALKSNYLSLMTRVYWTCVCSQSRMRTAHYQCNIIEPYFSHDNVYGWISCGVVHKWNQIKLIHFKSYWLFEERGKPEYPEKTSRCRVENQKTQPIYDAESANRIRATLVGGECNHHCTIPTPLSVHPWAAINTCFIHLGLICLA